MIRRIVPLVLTAVIGILTILSFFVPHSVIASPAQILQDWAIILVASGYVLGAANVFKVNGEEAIKRQKDWPYKWVLLGSMTVMMVMGFFLSGGARFLDPGTMFSWMYNYLYVPMQATMFSLLAFFIASAAFRAFRIRTLDAALLAIAALIVMIGRVPIGQAITSGLPEALQLPVWASWLLEWPQNAAKRGIAIGAGLGVMATGLRIILGIERAYMREES
ncbi:MAG: hypothetical protein ACREOU_10300 [Candidatus Eiseniibacteriota bacterium]